MNAIHGGFTAHDSTLGWSALCPCGWRGPWRGTLLSVVESDALEHQNICSADLPACGTLETPPALKNECSPHRVCARSGSVAQTSLEGRSEQ